MAKTSAVAAVLEKIDWRMLTLNLELDALQKARELLTEIEVAPADKPKRTRGKGKRAGLPTTSNVDGV